MSCGSQNCLSLEDSGGHRLDHLGESSSVATYQGTFRPETGLDSASSGSSASALRPELLLIDFIAVTTDLGTWSQSSLQRAGHLERVRPKGQFRSRRPSARDERVALTPMESFARGPLRPGPGLWRRMAWQIIFAFYSSTQWAMSQG
jgi:hypothetical protein